ncbi:MAG: hypothetical protein R3C62_20735 [Chloroflexota bacterium]
MKHTDKSLLIIVGGILLLIVAVFIFVLRRPAPQYQTEDSPESIAHNYLLSLRQQDYDRAYGYLSPTLVNYPATVNEFIDDIQSNRWAFRLDNDVSLAVESVRTTDNQATVTIQETTFYHSGLFDSSQSVDTFMMRLSQTGDGWKITQADAYWFNCWHRDSSSCP